MNEPQPSRSEVKRNHTFYHQKVGDCVVVCFARDTKTGDDLVVYMLLGNPESSVRCFVESREDFLANVNPKVQ